MLSGFGLGDLFASTCFKVGFAGEFHDYLRGSPSKFRDLWFEIQGEVGKCFSRANLTVKFSCGRVATSISSMD